MENLENVGISDFPGSIRTLERLFTPVRRSQPNLQAMSKVHILHLGDPHLGWLNFRRCLPYLQLDSLRTLSCYGVLDVNFVRPKGLVFGITELRLEGCCIKPRALKGFLLCFPSLKSLYLNLNNDDDVS